MAALQTLRNYFGTSIVYQSGKSLRASAIQQAVSSATGTYVVFLNQWVSLTPGWLSALLYSAQQLPQMGAVGALHLGPSQEVSEAGGLIFNDGLPSTYHKKSKSLQDLQMMYARRADFVSSTCMLMKRQFYIEMDGFDLQVRFESFHTPTRRSFSFFFFPSIHPQHLSHILMSFSLLSSLLSSPLVAVHTLGKRNALRRHGSRNDHPSARTTRLFSACRRYLEGCVAHQ